MQSHSSCIHSFIVLFMSGIAILGAAQRPVVSAAVSIQQGIVYPHLSAQPQVNGVKKTYRTLYNPPVTHILKKWQCY